MGVYSFHSSERLTQRSLIEDIFNKKGLSIHAGPILFIYYKTPIEGPFPCRIMFSVSKRRFKKAHDRNRIKRLMREIYRLNKHDIYQALQKSSDTYALAMLYLGSDLPKHEDLVEPIMKSIHGFVKRIS